MFKDLLLEFGKMYISELKGFLNRIPQRRSDKTLHVKKDRSWFRFYASEKESNKLKYLNKAQLPLVKSLAQEEYYDQLKEATLKQITFMEDFVRKLEESKSPDEVYDSLPVPAKELVTKLAVVDVQAWKEQYKVLPRNLPWTEKVNLRKNHPVEACDGTMVRSKSEALIIKVCIELGLEYVYEYPLKIGNTWYFPDFRILNMKTGKEKIYEHFGGIDSPEYAEKNLITKLRDYKKAGYETWDNLVYTFETHNYPLCEREVREFLTKHFL